MNPTKLIYLCFLIGVALWQHQAVFYLYRIIKNRLIIARDLKGLTERTAKKSYGKIGGYIKRILEASGLDRVFPSPETFIGISVMVTAGATWLLSLIETMTTSILFGVFLGSIPYLFVLTRLQQQRAARSKEGVILIHELLNNYKICQRNMREAIDMTAKTMEDAPHAKGVLLNLSRGLNNALTQEEISGVLEGFRYAIDTTWGNALASNIFFAYNNGIRVDFALTDLAESITKSRQVVEYSKQESNEARIMLVYLAPVSFFLSVLGACKYFGFTLEKYIAYQFTTPTGLKWFLTVLCCYICGTLVNQWFSQEKMDI